MSDFINIIRHERRLNAALKDIEIDELKNIQEKLARIIANREQEEAEREQQRQLKKIKIAELKRSMQEAGIDISDILEEELGSESLTDLKQKTQRKRNPKPAKYEYRDLTGETKTWTGQGRMPKALQQAINQGQSLDQFLIAKRS
ncbi:H-NS histone family protein [Idiomarina seosinensis]|uniref:H-NS family histone-like protein n=1 Tax=Idiomarina seosinensis TaxID=281739 RepID=UPI00384F13F9